jgi:hypothetical protein
MSYYTKVYRCGLCARLVITDTVVEESIINDTMSIMCQFAINQPKIEPDSKLVIHRCEDGGIGLLKFVGLQKQHS